MKSSIDKITLFFLRMEAKLGRNAPYIYMLVSSLFYSFMSLFIKFSKSVPPMQLIYMRTLVNALFCLLLNNYENYDLSPKKILTSKLLIRRGILGAITVMLYIYSLYFLPLSIVSTIQRTTPLWVGIVGALFYNESYKLKDFIATIVCLIGIILIFKPFSSSEGDSPKSHDYVLGLVLVIIYTFMDSFVCLTIRELRGKTSVIGVVFYFNLFSLIFSGVGCFFQAPKMLNSYEWEMLALVSLTAFGGHLLSSRSLFLEKAFMISVLSYSAIFFCYIFDMFILDETIDGLTYLGMLVIIISMVFLIISEKNK